jgi:DNA-binding CsgD family transcriptional regulator
MSGTAIVGREEELGSIRAFLASAGEGPAALVLSGEPGIGKTVLWEAVVEEAKTRFGRVLSCRGVEAEASFAFAGLSELLAGVLDEATPSLAPPRRRALEVALQLAEPGDHAPDEHGIGLAVLDVLGTLSEEGPVLVALDDVQWLDASSAAVLQVAVRRLRKQPVGILATLRVAPEVTLPFELERSFHTQRLTHLSLSPLSSGAVDDLLQERLGLQLTRAALVRVAETSGGNPFFALELGRQGVGLEPGQGLPVPESLGTLLGERLAALPAETRDVLLTVAAAGRPTIDVIVAAHGSETGIREALEVAVSDGVVQLDGERPRFAHPLLASIHYQQAPAAKQRAVHRALAGAVTDVEEHARHMALAAEGPDAIVADGLDRATDHAAARGATAAAGELAELAAALTPDDDPAQGRQRRLRAASLHRLAGDLERAVRLLEDLLSDVPPGPERADVLLELAPTSRNDLPRMVELCDQALVEASGDDARCARILVYLSWAHAFEADIRSALRDGRRALERAERVGDPIALAGAIAQLAWAETTAADITPGVLERGAEIEERLGLRLEYNESPRASLARRLIGTSELDRARAILEEAEAAAATWGNEEVRGIVLRSLGRVEWLAGRWQKALDHMALSGELWEQIQAPYGVALSGYLRALIETDLGLADAARASGEEGLAVAQAISYNMWEIHTLGALGRLELALGNLEAAGGYMRELPSRLLALGCNDPTAPVWSDAIEVLVGLGELERAQAYLDAYETHARRIGNPLAIAGAARCRGLLGAAGGETTAAVAAFEEALGELEGLPYPLDRGRTLLCLGSAHRRAKRKRDSRDALEAALEIFEELGARLWAERARAELSRISGRRRASEELTETEERVARLAADGRSNKQIASELFMSVHTVGAHLSRAYRKLGISSRSELAAHLAKDESGHV